MAGLASLGTQLRLLTAKLDGDVQAIYDCMGLSFRPRFYPIVQHLLRDGPTSVTALALATDVTQPAATQTLAEMAKVDLVKIDAGPNGRERSVRLTANGRRMAQLLNPIWEAVGEAARDLDRELPHPLSQTIAAAIAALELKPFRERIRKRIDDA